MYRQQKKKKSSQTAFIMMIGGAALFFIIVFAVVKGRSARRERPAPTPPPRNTRVNLAEYQRKEMYRSLADLKSMLRSTGNPQRSYKVLADRYKVSEAVVREVEAEGRQKGWPASGS